MRRVLVPAVVTASSILIVSPSYAASVFVGTQEDPPHNAVTIFRAEPGETNALVTDIFLTVTDSGAPLTAGDGCVSLGPNSARCDAPNVDAYLRDGDDTALLVVNGVGRLFAGNGDDEVGADSFGGKTLVYGEGGNDDIDAFGDTGQIADGGPGDDDIRVGAFFGAASAFGGTGSDTIYHYTALGGGPASLDGGNGDDTISAQPTGLPSIAIGGNGDDTITVRVPPDPSPAGSYSLFGGAGNDTLNGGGFDDIVDGGSGNDTIDVMDGGADTVTCGTGIDVVRHDSADTVAPDCEVLLG